MLIRKFYFFSSFASHQPPLPPRKESLQIHPYFFLLLLPIRLTLLWVKIVIYSYCIYYTHLHFSQRRSMEDFDKITNYCVSKETFEFKIKGLKDSLKTNKSSVNVFVEEEFYHWVKNYLKVVTEWELEITPLIKTPKLSKAGINTIKPKKWKYVTGKLLTTEGKEVAHQGMLFDLYLNATIELLTEGVKKLKNGLLRIIPK